MRVTNTDCKKTVAEAKLQYWEAKAKDKPGDLRSMWQSLKILKRAYNPPDHNLTTAEEGCYSPWRKKHGDFCSTLPAPAPLLSYPYHSNNFAEMERNLWVARTSPSPTSSWQEHSGVFDPPNHPLEVTGSPTPIWRSFQAPPWKHFWQSSTSAGWKGQSPRPGKTPLSYQSSRPTSLGGW